LIDPVSFLGEFQSLHLLEFAQEVCGLGFKEKPDYPKLRFLLEKIILNEGKEPSKVMCWQEIIPEESEEQIGNRR
jgi:hypothetical protein